jgi:hypothetical protein
MPKSGLKVWSLKHLRPQTAIKAKFFHCCTFTNFLASNGLNLEAGDQIRKKFVKILSFFTFMIEREACQAKTSWHFPKRVQNEQKLLVSLYVHYSAASTASKARILCLKISGNTVVLNQPTTDAKTGVFFWVCFKLRTGVRWYIWNVPNIF